MLGSYVFGFATQGVYFVVIAKTLGAAEFGLFAGAMALVSALSSMVGAGAGNVLVLVTARKPQAIKGQLFTAVVYIFATALPFSALALAIASAAGPGFVTVIVPLIISEIFTLRLFDLAQQVFQARDQLGRTAICGIFAGAIRVATALAFVFVQGTSAAFWAQWYAATTIFTAIVTLTWAINSIGKLTVDRESLRSTWKTGIFFSLGMASRTLYMDADKYILSSYGMLSAAGSFSAASKIITMASAPIQALVYSLNTKFFRAGADGSTVVWLVIRKPLLLIACYGVAVGILLSACSPLVPIILGASYYEASKYLWMLSPIVVLNGIHYLFGDALMGLGRQASRSLVQFGAACIAIIFNVIFIPVIGAGAAVISALGCSAGLALIMFTIFARGYFAEKRLRARHRLTPRERVATHV
ncbi:lipopolysaccharide biosynthesis protein [Arthrobacter bambusae]|uniref:lipopolysaccharide biosynthesis protein n=1 Tax=Arthrobacter bambusae TaxID=1338426 RepID=UPI002784F3EA|nr:oligosaccharide flippase family protein [Arthrobacter bambusae]MDQ0212055.1 O-antigen/teichoic acid export membrane protein [Arthrobacter bambusae]MDQ0236720.1 O-antigen/teichoic acid export membrane protein [Arthrobacter bambusae]